MRQGGGGDGRGQGGTGLHPVIRAAARGRLPEWTEAEPERRAHLERVSALMEAWATARGEAPDDVARWAAAGWLHDALRDADPEDLRPRVEESLAALPGPILHGPAAAERLRDEGVDDGPLLRAISFHTLGHPDLDALGMALYAADFLEPGRSFRSGWRASLRERMPGELRSVTREILASRIGYLLERERPIFSMTVDFWNRFAGDESRSGASEV